MSKSNAIIEYKIYKLSFPNGKCYIGMTKDLKNRMRCHKFKCKNIHNSILGKALIGTNWNNIKKEVIFQSTNFEEVCKKEAYFISIYKTQDHNFGYNQASGEKYNNNFKKLKPVWNKGLKFSEDFKNKLSQAKKGKKEYAIIAGDNARIYKVEVTDLLNNTVKQYKGITIFAEEFNLLPSTVYNHIRRNSNILNKRFKVKKILIKEDNNVKI